MSQRYFQWVAGERRGEVVFFDEIVQDEEMTFLTFKDGSRINSDLVAEINVTELSNKMMAEVSHPNNAWRFKETVTGNDGPIIEQDWESQQKFEVPSADDMAHADLTGETGTVKPRPKKKKIELIPPRPTKNKFGKIANSDDLAADYNESINKNKQEVSVTPVVPTADTSDPVYIMMDKSKKVDTEVEMTLTVSLPSAHLFDVVRDSFDDGDSKALEYIIENIDISEIKEALKEGIKQMYGVNEDPNDNKIQFKSPGISLVETDNTERFPEPQKKDEPIKTENDVFSAIVEVEVTDPTTLFEPEVIEEPIISDEKPGKIVDEIEGLQEK